MIFQNFQTFRLLIFGRLVLIHCMTHCIMQYIHISWPSLDFPCSSILRVDGSGLVESYGACVAVICRVWVLVLTAWRYIARRGSDGLPARSAASIQAASQPISTFFAEKGLWNLSKHFFSLSWNPDDFGSFLPFGTHGRCFDRGLGKRQRPEVFSGRERSFLRSGSFLRLSDHEIVWCTMRTRKCFIIALFDFASYCLGLYFIINSTISSIFFWRTFPPVSFNIFSFDQHSSGLEVL